MLCLIILPILSNWPIAALGLPKLKHSKTRNGAENNKSVHFVKELGNGRMSLSEQRLYRDGPQPEGCTVEHLKVDRSLNKAEAEGFDDCSTIPNDALDTSQPYFFRGLVDYSPDGIVVVDEAGRIVFANRTCESLLGYSEQELMGQTVDMLVPDAVRPNHAGYRATVTKSMTSRTMGRLTHLEARTSSGACIPVEIALTPLASDFGHFVVATIRDAARLNIEIKDRFGHPVVPREWFLVPLTTIDDAVSKIKDGTISKHRYSVDSAQLEPIEAELSS
jgi:PAS domain S-box-containing protein